MNCAPLTFHHLGLAVKQPREAENFLSTLGYQMGAAVFDPVQNVHLALCTHATQPAVEIIWPGDSQGPIDRLTQRHPAGIVYHVCYQTMDLAATLAHLEAAGLRVLCISSPSPAVLFGGRKVSFYNVAGMGLIEILE